RGITQLSKVSVPPLPPRRATVAVGGAAPPRGRGLWIGAGALAGLAALGMVAARARAPASVPAPTHAPASAHVNPPAATPAPAPAAPTSAPAAHPAPPRPRPAAPRAPGAVTVNAIPWGNVYLDGQRIGTTPVVNHSVPAGKHVVVIENPELGR